jgi:hypothetical protein
MSALNPTRKIGKMIAELLDSRASSYKEVEPELERGSSSSGSRNGRAQDVSDRALGRHEAAR